MAQTGPGIDSPGEWFIGSVNTTSLVLGQERAITIDNTVSPPVVRVNGVILIAGNDVWAYAPDPVTAVTSLHPNPAFVGVPVGADFLVPAVIAGASTEQAGTRLMFDISKGAIRAGTVVGANWNDANRGVESVGFGFDSLASGLRSVVGGGNSNVATSPYAVVAGGTSHIATGIASAIGGGNANLADGANSAIGGGFSNVTMATGTFSAIPGGQQNTCNGPNDACLGGILNTTNNGGACVGGQLNQALASGSTVFGLQCTATGQGSVVCGQLSEDGGRQNTFVWGDADGMMLTPLAAITKDNTVWWGCGKFATGGVDPVFSIYSTTNRAAGAVPGVKLLANTSAWVAISDASTKENMVLLDGAEVMRRVDELPIYEYNFKGSAASIRCRGPTAQDWHRLFPSDKPAYGIDTMDLDGITLAALKGLSEHVRALQVRVAELEAYGVA